MADQTGWQPTVREGEALEDVPLSQWIGEALGAASMCWRPRPTGEFDSLSAGTIAEAVEGKVERSLEASWRRGYEACREEGNALSRATTRELLNELRMRAENYAGVQNSGSGWLADRVDDAYVSLEGSPMMDGGREP